MFIIFIFGPCEPLISLVMYPAAHADILGMILVSGVFSIATILTMLSVVLISFYGINVLPLNKIERYMHAIAGFTILLSGLAIVFFGIIEGEFWFSHLKRDKII